MLFWSLTSLQNSRRLIKIHNHIFLRDLEPDDSNDYAVATKKQNNVTFTVFLNTLHLTRS